jgi:hypothetical protein
VAWCCDPPEQCCDIGGADLGERPWSQRRQDVLDVIVPVAVEVGGCVDELTQPSARVVLHRERPPRTHP